jgi:hypothetical protein
MRYKTNFHLHLVHFRCLWYNSNVRNMVSPFAEWTKELGLCGQTFVAKRITGDMYRRITVP